MRLRTRRLPLPLLLLSILLATSVANGQALTPETRRERFLKLIDRPRVDPEAKITEKTENDGVTQYRFEFSSEPDQRVAAIALLKTSFTEDGKQHPVAIVLHGTGGKKEGELPLLRKLGARASSPSPSTDASTASAARPRITTTRSPRHSKTAAPRTTRCTTTPSGT